MEIWVTILILFILFDILIVAFILYRKKALNKFSEKDLYYIRAHWVKIIDSFHAHPKHAILDADKLLDYALKKQGFEGSIGEKLKKSGPRFSDLNGLWNAHKLRNRIAHELGDIDKNEAKKALSQFKKALNDLGAKL